MNNFLSVPWDGGDGNTNAGQNYSCLYNHNVNQIPIHATYIVTCPRTEIISMLISNSMKLQ